MERGKSYNSITSKSILYSEGARLAASNGRLDVVERILRQGSAIPFEDDSTRMSALHCAARNGHAAIVETPLQKSCFLLNSRNALRETPLILAAQGGHVNVSKLLIEL